MFRYLIIFAALSSALCAQTDLVRWEAREPVYSVRGGVESYTNAAVWSDNQGVLGILKSGYKFFISDLDGDNCPFTPVCSEFFVQSVQSTNLVQGMLMFADRFTRDMNFVKINLYPLTPQNRFYDPVENYFLNDAKIKLSHIHNSR